MWLVEEAKPADNQLVKICQELGGRDELIVFFSCTQLALKSQYCFVLPADQPVRGCS